MNDFAKFSDLWQNVLQYFILDKYKDAIQKADHIDFMREYLNSKQFEKYGASLREFLAPNSKRLAQDWDTVRQFTEHAFINTAMSFFDESHSLLLLAKKTSLFTFLRLSYIINFNDQNLKSIINQTVVGILITLDSLINRFFQYSVESAEVCWEKFSFQKSYDFGI